MVLNIGPGGCGFTFLTWSLLYLRGDNYYTNTSGNIVDVNDSPLTGLTAHKFDKDHDYPGMIQPTQPNNSPNSVMFVVPKDNDHFVSLYSQPHRKIVFDNSQYCKELLARAILTVLKAPLTLLYNKLIVTYSVADVNATLLDCADKIYSKHYNVPKNALTLTYDEMFTTLDSQILMICDRVGISVLPDRLSQWQTIYSEYSARNKNILAEFKQAAAPRGNMTILKELISAGILCT